MGGFAEALSHSFLERKENALDLQLAIFSQSLLSSLFSISVGLKKGKRVFFSVQCV
jgi:hypothetical protein